LKTVMRKREGMPQPLQHMVSALGAGNTSYTSLICCTQFLEQLGFKAGR